jgi:hypothetical protein
MVVVEDTHELNAQVLDVSCAGIERRFVDTSCRRQIEVTKVRLFTRAS